MYDIVYVPTIMLCIDYIVNWWKDRLCIVSRWNTRLFSKRWKKLMIQNIRRTHTSQIHNPMFFFVERTTLQLGNAEGHVNCSPTFFTFLSLRMNQCFFWRGDIGSSFVNSIFVQDEGFLPRVSFAEPGRTMRWCARAAAPQPEGETCCSSPRRSWRLARAVVAWRGS